ncbi:hypothetical protein T07_6143 [Trichinella nelsoni]|uniref:Uncharacterized protein n=1 Tax=Trichinella nelsoni TaxID=6336 RepID=A0A0V0RCY2_9BILA|nr:hypothetical protein T07_6143 [Trichinella nelsoni]
MKKFGSNINKWELARTGPVNLTPPLTVGSRNPQPKERNHYLTSVGRNREKSLIVVEGTPDRSLQTDQPHIFVGAL